MAKPTLQNVFDAARSHLGDDQVAGGEVYTNTVLQPYFDSAYRQLHRQMILVGSPYVERETTYLVPAYTPVIAPEHMGVNDMGEILYVEERGGVTTIVSSTIANVTTATTGVVTITTSSAHGLTVGQRVTISGIAYSLFLPVNGTWVVSDVASSTVFSVKGPWPLVAASGNNEPGTISRSTEQFVPMVLVDRIGDVESAAAGSFGEYAWDNDSISLRPSTENRHIRVGYLASGAPPSSTSSTIHIDDSLDPLAFRTGGLAAQSRGATDLAADLNAIALGPTFAIDGNLGGLYLELLQAAVRANQGLRYRRPPFRSPRSNGPLSDSSTW